MQITPRDTYGLIAKIIHYLFPSHCPLCRGSTDNIHYAPFCIRCWSGIKRYPGPACGLCAAPLASTDADICLECLKRASHFSKVYSFGLYEGVLAAVINHYKFHGIKRLHKPLGKLLCECKTERMDAIVPVPLSRKGLKSRGFNQSLLLARIFAETAHIPVIMDGLIKIKETPPQVGLAARERVSNLGGAFRSEQDFTGMRLLLIDDVMTTGATAQECAKTLLKSGAKKIQVLTLARASSL